MTDPYRKKTAKHILHTEMELVTSPTSLLFFISISTICFSYQFLQKENGIDSKNEVIFLRNFDDPLSKCLISKTVS